MSEEEMMIQDINENCYELYSEEYVEQLQQENIQLKQQYEKLEEKYINNVPCCNENDCEMFKDYMLLKQQLKDKDEKISKTIEYIKTKELPYYGIFPLDDDDYRKDILEILESNKED